MWSVVRSHTNTKYSATFFPDDCGLMTRDEAVSMATKLNDYIFSLSMIGHWIYKAVPLPFIPNDPNLELWNRYI